MSADNAKMIADAIEAWRQSERLEKIERYKHLKHAVIVRNDDSDINGKFQLICHLRQDILCL